MKNNGKRIIVMFLLAVVAVGSYLVSGTYAKYTKALSGSDTATVAKFSVSATGLNAEGNDATFELFDTIKEADTTTSEDNVAAGKIAPGTGGSFAIALTNDSDVDVKAEIKISETANAKNVPIEYATDLTGSGNWAKAADFTKTIDKLDYKGKTSGTSTDNITIYWRWAYESATEAEALKTADAADTTIGEYGDATAPTVEATVSATFTQIN